MKTLSSRFIRLCRVPLLLLAGLLTGHAADPTGPAPVPTHAPAQVIALANTSSTYPNVAVDTWLTPWSVGAHNPFVIPGSTNAVHRYSTLNYAGVEFFNPKINASGMTRLHIDLWTPDATRFSVKLVSFGASTAEKEIVFTNSTIVQNQWVSLDIPLSDFTGVDKSVLGQLLFINNAGGVENGTFFIDNVYFWNDGDVPPPPPAPATAAPVPTRPAGDVKSLHNSSGTYPNETVDTWRAGWSQGNVSDYTITGTTSTVKKYSSLNYAGVEFFNPKINAAGMTKFHLDLWTPDATKFSLKLVSFSPNAAEKEIYFTNTTIVKNQWVGIDIPLSQFTGVDPGALGQLLFIDNAGGVENGTFYIDYFYDDGTGPPPPLATPLTAAPVPTRPAGDVKSLHNSSGTYPNEPVDTWRAAWSQGNLTDYLIGDTGLTVKKYAGLNYAGVEFFNPQMDASGMTRLHLDLWTPDATKFSIKLVSFPGAAEFEIFFNNTTIVKNQWVSLDIPLAQFTGVNLATLGQMLFIDNAGGVENGTFYIDNVYFHRPTAIPVPAAAAGGTIVLWLAAPTGSYQPQRSSDGVTWTSFGSAFTGNSVTTAFDPLNLPFHRILATPAGGGAPAVLTATRQAGLQISWPSTAGRHYQVQSSFDLTEWLPLGGVITATGTTSALTDPFSDDACFYRVHEVP